MRYIYAIGLWADVGLATLAGNDHNTSATVAWLSAAFSMLALLITEIQER